MIFFRKSESPKISMLLVVLSAVIVATQGEQFPSSYARANYLQGLEGVGTLAQLQKLPEYSRTVSEVDRVFRAQPFLGVDKSLGVPVTRTSEEAGDVSLFRAKRAVVIDAGNISLSNVTSPSSDSLSNVTSPSSDSLSNVTSPSSDSLSNVTSPSSDSLSNVTSPSSDSLSNVTSFSSDSLSNVTTFSSDSLSNVTSSSSDSLSNVTSLSSDSLSNVTSPSSESLSNVTSPADFSDTSSSEGFLTTSGDSPNKTDPGTTERSSSPFPRTSQQIPTSSPAPTSQCLQDTQRVFSSVVKGEPWPLAFLDSWGKPGPGLLKGQFKFVGNYRECLESTAPGSNETGSAGFHGNYCSVKLDFPGAGLNSLAAAFGASAELGACMPSSCSAQDVSEVFTQGLKAANLTSLLAVTAVDCRSDHREYTSATIVSIIFLSIIGLLMLLGTAFDILFVQWPKWAESWASDDEEHSPANEKTNGYHPIKADDTAGETRILLDDEKHVTGNGASNYPEDKHDAVAPKFSESRPLLGNGKKGSDENSACCGILSKVLMAFSAYSNGKKLLNTSQPAGSLGAIHGIRFLSMSWVILGHFLLFSVTYIGNTGMALPVFINRWTFDALSNALVSVDTFFALSGLLTSYLVTKEIQKKGWKLNWAMYYFHRFWRLTPPYMLVLLIGLGLHQFLGSGALWASVQPLDKTFCETHWWTNLLYVNNFVSTKQMCMAHSWYLANDMQFHILSPLLIVPFYFNVYAGLGSCAVFLLASWITSGVLTASNDWPSTLLQAAVLKEGTLDFQEYYYYAPYCRIGPFIIGILAGYFLAITKGRFHMKWYYAIVGWAVAISVGLAAVYGIHGDITGLHPNTIGVKAFYNSMARTAWGACVCWVIVACRGGYGGPVNAILSWSPFVVLGRLTYMAYLIHPTIIYAYFENMDQLFLVNDTNLVINHLGILVFTNMVSFVLVLAFESPMIGLEKIFLRH